MPLMETGLEDRFLSFVALNGDLIRSWGDRDGVIFFFYLPLWTTIRSIITRSSHSETGIVLVSLLLLAIWPTD